MPNETTTFDLALYHDLVSKNEGFGRTAHSTTSLLILGLCGECGEVANEYKKMIRDDHVNEPADSRRARLLQELGDVLYYLTATSISIGSSLSEIGQLNIEKTVRLRATTSRD